MTLRICSPRILPYHHPKMTKSWPCSPTNLRYLALGLLFPEGMIKSEDQIKKIRLHGQRGVVRVETEENRAPAGGLLSKPLITPKPSRNSPGWAKAVSGYTRKRVCCIGYIARSLRMRSLIGGCVEKRLLAQLSCPLRGLAMYRCAVALLATSSGSVSAAIFSRARASPSG